MLCLLALYLVLPDYHYGVFDWWGLILVPRPLLEMPSALLFLNMSLSTLDAIIALILLGVLLLGHRMHQRYSAFFCLMLSVVLSMLQLYGLNVVQQFVIYGLLFVPIHAAIIIPFTYLAYRNWLDVKNRESQGTPIVAVEQQRVPRINPMMIVVILVLTILGGGFIFQGYNFSFGPMFSTGTTGFTITQAMIYASSTTATSQTIYPFISYNFRIPGSQGSPSPCSNYQLVWHSMPVGASPGMWNPWNVTTTIHVAFTSNGPIDFFILSTDQASKWSTGNSTYCVSPPSSSLIERTSVSNFDGIIQIPTSGFYDVVFYSQNHDPVFVNFEADYPSFTVTYLPKWNFSIATFQSSTITVAVNYPVNSTFHNPSNFTTTSVTYSTQTSTYTSSQLFQALVYSTTTTTTINTSTISYTDISGSATTFTSTGPIDLIISGPEPAGFGPMFYLGVVMGAIACLCIPLELYIRRRQTSRSHIR